MTTTQSSSGAPAVNSAESIVEFGRRWYPYGGGPAEDILVEFGWTPARYFAELQDRLSTQPPAHLSPAVIASMLEVCRGRIWMNQ